MKAIILAAGLGTRLKPITDNIPKALVEINNKTLLELAVLRLINFGIKDIVINVHHFADKVVQYLKEKNNFGVNIFISDERELLLDSGGGIKKAAEFLNGSSPFLVYNVDIISNIDLNKMLEEHKSSDRIATLAVRKRDSSRYFLFDDENRLHGWQNIKTNEIKPHGVEIDKLKRLAFSGIHIIDPKIFKLMPDGEVFSIVDVYLSIAKSEKIIAYKHDEDFWLDVGKKVNLDEAKSVLYK